MISILVGFAGGTGMPIQTSINARLTKRTGTPYTTAMVNFLVGTAALVLVTLIIEHNLAIPFGKIIVEPWLMLGGVFAVVFVTSNILLMPRLGSVQTVILPASGQMLMSLCIERFGWFDSQYAPTTIPRVAGVIMVFIGVLLIIFAKQGSKNKDTGTQAGPVNKSIWLWRLLGFISGACMASQTAVNSHLGIVADSRVTAALINFCVGTTVLIILNMILLPKKKPGIDKSNRPLWMWCGGLLGDLYVLGNIFVGQTFGTSVAVVTALTGMMTGGLLVDQFGWFQSVKNPINLKKVLGLITMIAGAAMIYLI